MLIPDGVELLPPWVPLADSPEVEQRRSEALVRALDEQLAPDHVLAGHLIKAVARRRDNDDVLFEVRGDGKRMLPDHRTWEAGEGA